MAKVLLQININNLRIADVDTGSAVAIGNNYFFDWKTYSKSNSGFGRLSGDRNSIAEADFKVDDPDWQDMICMDRPDETVLRKLLDID
ncbi:hypothetical protein L7E55_06385 [Pelotomaculum isophthalicicum JI]|uniref:Uncharacterized protein n=1 Tax=Pelotomaculum isophthalicicum JI TaxID=947010 RepID=A0A9X4JT22_9FIRM|nr:hypothetical protein [Pelotomaculum isophthalicicum]MDF9407989.1 hypothetical protein [Pelotomaculum isophthalicicum JI]